MRTPARSFVAVMPASVGRDDDAAVVDVHEAAVADDLDVLTGQPHPGQIVRRGEADRPASRDPTVAAIAGIAPADPASAVDRPSMDPPARRGRAGTAPRGDHPDALVRPVVVVVLDPHVQFGLGVLDRVEHPPGEELAAQRLVEPLDLARRRRRPRRGQQVLDAVLPADPIEQHLTGPGPEPAGEHLAVVGQDLGRAPIAAHRQRQRVTRRPRRRPRHDPRRDAEPRWSSTPVTILASGCPAIRTPPTMSICHNSIARDRSHRL